MPSVSTIQFECVLRILRPRVRVCVCVFVYIPCILLPCIANIFMGERKKKTLLIERIISYSHFIISNWSEDNASRINIYVSFGPINQCRTSPSCVKGKSFWAVNHLGAHYARIYTACRYLSPTLINPVKRHRKQSFRTIFKGKKKHRGTPLKRSTLRFFRY